MAMVDIPKLCWICGDIATTGEHLHKKTDVTAMFGDQFSKRVVRTDLEGNDKKFIQSPNSKGLMFRNNLCAKCNNARTQSYDLAYEMFAGYMRENHTAITRELEINMNLVFGKREAREKQQHLFRYFAKAFGCRLHDAGVQVPPAVIEIVARENYGKIYRLSVCINNKKLDALTTYNLEGDHDENGNYVDYYWMQDNGWFTIVHCFNRPISSKFGDEWFGKSKRLKVGMWTDI